MCAQPPPPPLSTRTKPALYPLSTRHAPAISTWSLTRFELTPAPLSPGGITGGFACGAGFWDACREHGGR
jgi:hypothetical protein